jgi:UTP--glucose-1-phosphate uridylyltransferase
MMPAVETRFAPFEIKMRNEGLPEIVIQTFRHYYTQLVADHSGLIQEQKIAPLQDIPVKEQLPAGLAATGKSVLPKTVVLKLNGGLGTSMGLKKAKSLLPVKNGLTFLDIIARQALRNQVPLVLMNSFNTQADSLALLAKFPELHQAPIPLTFMQNKVPKVVQADLTPATYPDHPENEWAPPGHGDFYTALVTSGLLEKMLAAGYEYAFVSNADNLGAVLDYQILGHFAQNNFPFMMEVADRTEADKKGGHLAVRPDGQLLLRESAQVDSADLDYFQDISRYRYFNTNNIWLNLPTLQSILAERDNIMGLPMIRNGKTVNPRDKQSTPVYQVETAIGSAIAVIKGSAALRVPRSRFAPVKTTSDLLAIRSDAYVLTADDRIVLNPQRTQGPVIIDLDSSFYKRIDDMESRFPHGAPSLLHCTALTVTGDISFGREVSLRGQVHLSNQSSVPISLPHHLAIQGV